MSDIDFSKPDSAEPPKSAETPPTAEDVATLTGGLAHEIKNPLSTIRLNLELLKEDFSREDLPVAKRALKKLDLLQRECQRLQDILDDFLNFVRGKELELEETSLNQQVQKVIDFFRLQAAEAKIDLIPYLGNDLPPVWLDQESFFAALLNLVLNAQQAMPNGGQLMFRTQVLGEEVRLELIDTGPGIEPQIREKIFKPFFSYRAGGTGLGLPFAKKIIEQHGGRMDLQTELGKGTCFSIYLPVDAAQESQNQQGEETG
ncbi:Integral membrane sensor signal transduction histidine kinase [Planctomycetales bacterium 10988]|nr:Integral membrane sensor signal transduction histidine kinase [Planctomycetales bacterium 10988]